MSLGMDIFGSVEEPLVPTNSLGLFTTESFQMDFAFFTIAQTETIHPALIRLIFGLEPQRKMLLINVLKDANLRALLIGWLNGRKSVGLELRIITPS